MLRTRNIRYRLAQPLIVLLPLVLMCSAAHEHSATAWVPSSPAFRSYYGWDDTGGTWQLDYCPMSDGKNIALHTFTPRTQDAIQGTVFVLHGYLDHTALRVPVIQNAIQKNWMTAGFDLQGHGLSEGEPHNISNFSYYAEAFNQVLESHPWPKPWRVIAHSTGCAVTLMHIQNRENPFELVILEAPLIRSWMWHPSMAALSVFGRFVTTLPRRTTGLDEEEPMYTIQKEDPLYTDTVPVSWSFALRRFVDSADDWSSMDGNFIILQGDSDTVVDANYNIPLLQRLLPDADIHIIENGKHILLCSKSPAGNEARRIVNETWPPPQ